MMNIKKSKKLENVLYDIRGPVPREAQRLEEEGYQIIKLNIGNPAPFGFDAPEEIIHDVIINLPAAQGYCESKGIFPARKAVMQYCQQKGIFGVDTEHIYVGNGVSELIVMALQALLDSSMEVLLPAPDYPLWTAATNLAGGNPVHYICDENSDWYPDLEDIEKKITPNTKAIVVINPNNPTGAVYPREILEGVIGLARKHKLIVFADEIYDKILYDDAEHTSLAALADDILCITFNGLSKSYRAAGFRAGWMVISGNRSIAKDYLEGIEMLASMRLCSNVPSQFAIQTALGGYQSINDLVLPGGRLKAQRDYAHSRLVNIPGVSCVKPKGALYMFPRIDIQRFGIKDDRQMVLDLLLRERVLLVQGTGFNWPAPDHFRLVFLPREDTLQTALDRFERFMENYSQ
ncbi:MAG: pyridoxal phosphate-dependent aminotransferase [Chitinispirillaceae bacterium]